MKKLTYSITIISVIFISAVIFITSCNKKSTITDSIKTNYKVINQENSPDIPPDIYTKLGFVNFVPDDNRKVLLDYNKSELLVPYNNLKSSFSKNGNDFKSVGIGICIKIATRKSNCSQGIGFRCGFIRNCHKLAVEKSEIVGLSRDRVQPVEITVNKKNREIILHFINKIDWKYLENN